MKIVRIMLLILCIFLGACTPQQLNDNESKQGGDPQILQLSFRPQTIQRLQEGEPKENWIRAKSVYFGKLKGQLEATIHLYVEETTADNGTVYGFLEYEKKIYEIGEVGSYGVEDVDIGLVDSTDDGVKEMHIEGDMGAAYSELKIIGYDAENDDWLLLLSMGSPRRIDLDENGSQELVVVSQGSIPSYVEIYRWNQQHFEGASVTEATDSTYAHLYYQEGAWIIEAGKVEGNQAKKPRFYRYDEGTLIER